MFGGKKQDNQKSSNTGKSSKIDTLIGQNTEIRGDITFTGGLHVDGTIKGNVMAEQQSGSVLSISENGFIEGEVRVPNIVHNGNVEGDIYASDHIELASQARVKGNVYYALIEMARGAEVNGNLVHRSGDSIASSSSSSPSKPVASGPSATPVVKKEPEKPSDAKPETNKPNT